jgi:hypothetical protein
MPRKPVIKLEGLSCIVCVNLATHNDLCEQCAAREVVTDIFSDKPLKAKHLMQEAEKAYASGVKLTLEQEAFRFFELPFYARKWRDELDANRTTRRACVAVKLEQAIAKEQSSPKPKTPRKAKPAMAKQSVPEAPIAETIAAPKTGTKHTRRKMIGKKYNTLIVVADLDMYAHSARKVRVICSVCNKLFVVMGKALREGSCVHYVCDTKDAPAAATPRAPNDPTQAR